MILKISWIPESAFHKHKPSFCLGYNHRKYRGQMRNIERWDQTSLLDDRYIGPGDFSKLFFPILHSLYRNRKMKHQILI